jgi:RNA recognition motif-containing protein
MIFLGNLPFDVDEEEVWKLFEKKKLQVSKIRIIRDKHELNGKGFGYVTFADQENAKKAVGYKGRFKIRDRILRITHSDRKAKEHEKEKKEKMEKIEKERSEKKKPSQTTTSVGKLTPGTNSKPTKKEPEKYFIFLLIFFLELGKL